MDICVIGATGFIGPPVVRRLAAKGHTVTALHRGETEADLPESVRVIHGDRNRRPELRDALKSVSPDVVVDLLLYTEAQAQQAVGVFAGRARRLVAVSSSDVYRNYDGWRGAGDHPPDPVPLAEDAPLRETRYPYRGDDGLDFAYAEDYDKCLVERAVKGHPELPATVLRLPAVYGPGDPNHRFASFWRRMADERPFILLDDAQAHWRWTHGYVENVAAAIAQAATDERAAGQIYNVGERDTPTVAERVRKLAEIVGWTGEGIELAHDDLPDHLQTPFNWRYELATDTSRIREHLDYREPITKEKALEETFAWWQTVPTEGDRAAAYAAEDEAVRHAL